MVNLMRFRRAIRTSSVVTVLVAIATISTVGVWVTNSVGKLKSDIESFSHTYLLLAITLKCTEVLLPLARVIVIMRTPEVAFAKRLTTTVNCLPVSRMTDAAKPGTLLVILGRPTKPVPVIVIVSLSSAVTEPLTWTAFRGGAAEEGSTPMNIDPMINKIDAMETCVVPRLLDCFGSNV